MQTSATQQQTSTTVVSFSNGTIVRFLMVLKTFWVIFIMGIFNNSSESKYPVSTNK